MIEDAKKGIKKRNEETFRAAKEKTSEMLEYLRRVYSEIKEENEGFNVYDCGTSSEELPPTRLPEEAVEGIMGKLDNIVSNHKDWLIRMARHLISEAGIEPEYKLFV
jgi:hypothetical protein